VEVGYLSKGKVSYFESMLVITGGLVIVRVGLLL
jgi:hypothetical protein